MSTESDKRQIFEDIVQKITTRNFTIVGQDRRRPWGGFLVIDEQQAQQFADTYFGQLSVESLKISGKLSPKILIVAPGKRLSWQYHHRRAEIWSVIKGPAGIITSDTDEQGPLEEYDSGEIITLRQGERHRLVGLDNWGILAEIWQYTDSSNPSDEDDIIRLEDDFGR